MEGTRQPGSPAARSIAALVLVLAVVCVLGSASWGYYLCHEANYNCPANGCGEVPQRNCEAGTTFAAATLVVGTLVSVGALLVLLRPRHSAPRDSRSPAP